MNAAPQWFTVTMQVRLLPQEAHQFGWELTSLIQGSTMQREYHLSSLKIEPWPAERLASDAAGAA